MVGERDSRGRFKGKQGPTPPPNTPGDFTVDMQVGPLTALLHDIPALLHINLRNAFRVIGMQHRNALIRMHRAAPPRGGGLFPRKGAGDDLSRGTGRLLSDLSQGTELRGADINTLVMLRYMGRGVPYARVQEYGGTIRPVRRRVLTVPTIHHRTQAGISRGRAIHQEGYWRRTKGGSLFFFDKHTGLPLFGGFTKVYVPPRLKFVQTWDEAAPQRTEVLAGAVFAAVHGRKWAPGVARG